MPPKGVVCYICGREFGYASFGVHEPQCLKVSFFFIIIANVCLFIFLFYIYIFKKWEADNARKPPNQRQPKPQKPTILPSLNGSGSASSDQDRFNQVSAV